MDERRFLIRWIVTFYAAGIAVFCTDLAICEVRKAGQCDSSRGRLEGAITTAPAALLALLVKTAPGS
ncbi:MAG: hypothetical protein ACO3GP_09360 [Candidatus Limnocylindrus sp.]